MSDGASAPVNDKPGHKSGKGERMSADNWTLCPKCTERISREQKEKEQKIDSQYGVLPPSDFVRQYKESRNVINQEETLREDYDFYNNDGILLIKYRCGCSECDFVYEFKKKIQVYPVVKDL